MTESECVDKIIGHAYRSLTQMAQCCEESREFIMEAEQLDRLMTLKEVLIGAAAAMIYAFGPQEGGA
jgi:hypothetical protein